jgi:hypothetical protein
MRHHPRLLPSLVLRSGVGLDCIGRTTAVSIYVLLTAAPDAMDLQPIWIIACLVD